MNHYEKIRRGCSDICRSKIFLTVCFLSVVFFMIIGIAVFIAFIDCEIVKDEKYEGVGSEPGFTFVSRSEWCALTPKKPPHKYVFLPVNIVVISHTNTNECTNRLDCIQECSKIQNYHMFEKNWRDIGYSFLVGGDGAVYEGVGWEIEGAHTLSFNNKSIGISLIGNFINGKRPNDQQFKATQLLIEAGLTMRTIRQSYKLYGHCQLSSGESPGIETYKVIKEWLHWSAVDQKYECHK